MSVHNAHLAKENQTAKQIGKALERMEIWKKISRVTSSNTTYDQSIIP